MNKAEEREREKGKKRENKEKKDLRKEFKAQSSRKASRKAFQRLPNLEKDCWTREEESFFSNSTAKLKNDLNQHFKSESPDWIKRMAMIKKYNKYTWGIDGLDGDFVV